MDLSDIDGWTREALESEARRIGVKGSEYRSRTELVRLILRDRYGETWNAGRAKLARGVRTLGEARALLGLAIERTIASVLDLPDALVGARGASYDVHTAPTVPGNRSAPAAARAVGAATPVAAVAARQRSELGSAAPQGEDASPSVLAEAGAGADDPAPRAPAAGVEANAVDVLSWVQMEPTEATIRWRASEAGIRRARAVLDAQGELTLRIVVVVPDRETFVRSDVIDHGPVEASGDLPAPDVPGGASRVAAVGVRAGARFVSIAHARA